jgi:hypothetical protein
MPRKAQPYSKVLIGARKEAARTKYLQFLAGTATRESKIGTKGNRPASIKLSVDPFGYALPSTVFAACSALKSAVTAFQAIAAVSSRVNQGTKVAQSGITLSILGPTDDALKLGDVTPARFIRKVYESANATPKASETTGLKYGYRKSASLSMPFGADAANETQATAFAAISAAVLAAAPTPDLTEVNLQPELI